MHRGPQNAQDVPDDLEDCIEILSCVRQQEIRTYRLRVVQGGAELWRTSESRLTGVHSVKESDFQSSEQVTGFLEDLRRALIAGGWREA